MVHSAAKTDPDAALLTRIAAQDSQAFSQLMSRHLDRIVAFSERMTGSKAEAEDIAQEVFLKAWQWAERWQPGQALFSTWAAYRRTQCLPATLATNES